MIKTLLVALTLLVVPFAAGAAPAKSTARTSERHTRQAQARITPDAARATALAKVPGAVVQSQELEREHGKLIYSFDLKVPGKTGIDEVNVDAITGKVLVVQHETPKQESQEKGTDNRARQKGHS
jgi:uncharacterized membrane protein YkoI